jgi:hypothetical protein
MVRLSEAELKRLIRGGEMTTVELKLAAPRPVEMAERLCGTRSTASAEASAVPRDIVERRRAARISPRRECARQPGREISKGGGLC